MEPKTRSEMEAAFNQDFGGVHIHADANADKLSKELSAKAFTAAKDIFFSRGTYQPSWAGKGLLAHELTHVIQQCRTPEIGEWLTSQEGDASEVEARASEWRGQPALCIAFRDTGIGIPPDEHERIFERFYRGRHTPVGTDGTGLGLTIVRESMALHGGDVTVESAVGQGSTFTLCFPLEMEVNYA